MRGLSRDERRAVRWAILAVLAYAAAGAVLLMLLGCAAHHRSGGNDPSQRYKGGAGGERAAARLGDLRASPRIAFQPAHVTLLLPLPQPLPERLWGAQILWDYGDGNRSSRQSDVLPWSRAEAEAAGERSLSSNHCYPAAGEYLVSVSLLGAGGRVLERREAVIRVEWAAGGGGGCRW